MGVAVLRLGALKVHVRVSGPLLIPQQPQGLCPPPAGGAAATQGVGTDDRQLLDVVEQPGDVAVRGHRAAPYHCLQEGWRKSVVSLLFMGWGSGQRGGPGGGGIPEDLGCRIIYLFLNFSVPYQGSQRARPVLGWAYRKKVHSHGLKCTAVWQGRQVSNHSV